VALAGQRSGLVAAAAARESEVVDVPGNVSAPAVARVAAYWEARAGAAAAFDMEFLTGCGTTSWGTSSTPRTTWATYATLLHLFRFGAQAP
jgi:hypothetical protein